MVGTNQCIGPGRAKKFKEFGILQKSLLCWHHMNGKDWDLILTPQEYNITNKYPLLYFAAFTSQELRLMIPDELVIENVCYSIFEAKWSYGDFKLFYHNKEIRDIGRGAIYKFINENECTVRSDLLQKLLEDDRVSVNLINKRISKFHGKVIL